MHRNHPETHRRLLTALKREVVAPRVKKGSSATEKHEVSAHAVFRIAELSGTFDDMYFIDVLRKTNNNKDPRFRIRRSAMHALQSRMDVAITNRVVRDALFMALETTKIQMDEKPTESKLLRGPYSAILDVINTFPNIVDALEATSAEDGEPGLLGNLLDLIYRTYGTDESYDKDLMSRHAAVLGGLFWHESAMVRNKSRVCLSKSDPVGALALLAENLRDPNKTIEDDFVQFAAISAKLTGESKEQPGPHEAEYNEAYKAGCDALFSRCWPKVSIGARESVLSLFLNSDPERLSGYLVALTPAEISNQNSASLLQLARYLGACKRAVNQNQALAGGLNESMHLLLAYPELEVRKQVVAQFWPYGPVLILKGLQSVMSKIVSEDQDSADFLLNIWLTCLERYEQGEKKGEDDIFGAAVKSLELELGHHPYACLAKTVDRPEFEMTCRLGAFLSKRDPGLLLHLLLKRVGGMPWGKINAEEVAYIGNASVTFWPELDHKLQKELTDWFNQGLTDERDDIALLNGSILSQLDSLDEEAVAPGSHTVKEMWRFINE